MDRAEPWPVAPSRAPAGWQLTTPRPWTGTSSRLSSLLARRRDVSLAVQYGTDRGSQVACRGRLHHVGERSRLVPALCQLGLVERGDEHHPRTRASRKELS